MNNLCISYYLETAAETHVMIQKCENVHLFCVFAGGGFFAVDGNWGPWQVWGECSASCGNGERTRVRLCNSPSPSNGGRSCPGDSSQLSRCNSQACPGRTFWYCICVQISAGLNTVFDTLCFCQVGPKRREEASEGTSMTLGLVSPSSMPPFQTARLVAESSKPPLPMYQEH